jgi:ABC-type long-subunit fatty acid transport system fused permease/ATPase subunit
MSNKTNKPVGEFVGMLVKNIKKLKFFHYLSFNIYRVNYGILKYTFVLNLLSTNL